MLENVQGLNIIEMSQAAKLQTAELQTTQHTAALQRALVTILTMLQLPLLCNVLHTFYYPLWQSSQKLCNFHICVILHRRTENQRQQKVFNTAFHVPSPQASSIAYTLFTVDLTFFTLTMCECQAWVWCGGRNVYFGWTILIIHLMTRGDVERSNELLKTVEILDVVQ